MTEEKPVFRNIQEKFRHIESARDSLKTFIVGTSYAFKSKLTQDVETLQKLHYQLILTRQKIMQVLEQSENLNPKTEDKQERELLESLLLTEQFVQASEQSLAEMNEAIAKIFKEIEKISTTTSNVPGLRNLKPIYAKK